MRKLTFEQAKEVFEKESYILLSTNYEHARVPMEVSCPDGHITNISYDNFRRGKRCGVCAGNRKYDYEDIKNMIESYGYSLISTDYINALTPLKCVCPNGHVVERTINNIKKSKKCILCIGNKLFDFDFVYNYFKEEGYTLLSTEYINAGQKLEYICPSGHRGSIRFNNFRLGVRCGRCKGGIRLSEEDRKVVREHWDYQVWRRSVYARDNYTCQKCGATKKYLNAHHIENFATNKELRMDSDNAITLCADCHTAFHKKYGYTNNNREQFEEYLEE